MTPLEIWIVVFGFIFTWYVAAKYVVDMRKEIDRLRRDNGVLVNTIEGLYHENGHGQTGSRT